MINISAMKSMELSPHKTAFKILNILNGRDVLIP